MPQKVLVTGAAGFIGSHLVELLVRKGCVVVSLSPQWGERIPRKEISRVEPLEPQQTQIVDNQANDPEVTPKIGANRCVPKPGIFMRSGGPMGWGIHGEDRGEG
jgi:nucleoside-diphosphate-sugar epimerase